MTIKRSLVPSSKLSNEIILNLSRQGKRPIDIALKCKYHLAFEKVKESIIARFSSLNILLTEPPLRIGISALDTDNYAVIINTWVPAHGFEDNELMSNEKLMKALKNAGLAGIA